MRMVYAAAIEREKLHIINKHESARRLSVVQDRNRVRCFM